MAAKIALEAKLFAVSPLWHKEFVLDGHADLQNESRHTKDQTTDG